MRTLLCGAASVLIAAAALCYSHSTASAIDPLPADEQGIEVQGRGPIHEAFAQPIETTPKPGPVIPKQPPKPVPELPPEQKPKGDNVQWIPGYWGWDTDKKDFLWVSGLWRNIPPGQRWVPGHWTNVDGGWQWVSGTFLAATQTDVKYLDAPPDSLEYGPSAPQPYGDTFYVPGCWVPRASAYYWRPGYWTQAYAGYVWTPAHYCYSPSGYVYVAGYWDYPLVDRGFLYAPVWFSRPYWDNPGWYYRPRFFVGIDGLFASLWFWPHHHHYFFGDFYGSRYWDRGFRPWYAYGSRHFDPLYSYYGWRHRGDAGWFSGLHNTFQARVDGTSPVPVRSFTAARGLTANATSVVRPVTQIQNNNFTNVTTSQQLGQGFHQLRQQRSQFETANRTPGSTWRLPPAHDAVTTAQQSAGSHVIQGARLDSRTMAQFSGRPSASFSTTSPSVGAGARQFQPSAVTHAPAQSPVIQSQPMYQARRATYSTPSRSSYYSPAHVTPSPSYHASPAPTYHAAPSYHGGGSHFSGGGHGGGGHSSGGHGHHK